MKPTALLFTSERELPRNNAGQWNSCRIVSILCATGLATRNECFLRADGRHKGLPGRIDLAIKGLKGADGYWRQDTGFSQADVDEVHAAMFPGLPMPELVGTEDWWGLVSHLPQEITTGSRKGQYTEGHAISISLRLAVLPLTDAARRWTSADHQVVLRAMRRRNGAWEVKRIDPMRPQKDGYQGDWVPLSSVKQAALAINGGVIIAELYPIDKWTAEVLVRRRKNAEIRIIDATLDLVEQQRDDARDRVRTVTIELEQLQELHAQCETPEDDNAAVRAATLDMAEELVIENVRNAFTELRDA